MQSVMSDIELARNDIKYLNKQIYNLAPIITLNGERIEHDIAIKRIDEIKNIVENLVEEKNIIKEQISFIRSIDDERVDEAQ